MNHSVITFHLYGLRIVMQLIVLSFYKKALRIINFQPRISHSSLLFKRNFIPKFSDKVTWENSSFVSKSISNHLFTFSFQLLALFSCDQHNYETSWSYLSNLHKPSYKSNIYGKNYIDVSPINAWNNSQNLLKIFLYVFVKKKFDLNIVI